MEIILLVVAALSLAAYVFWGSAKPQPHSKNDAVRGIIEVLQLDSSGIFLIVNLKETDIQMLNLHVGETRKLNFAAQAADGSLTTWDNMPSWEVVGESISIKVSEDGLTAEITALKAGGQAVISAAADGAQDDDVITLITGTLDVGVYPADAVAGVIGIATTDAGK